MKGLFVVAGGDGCGKTTFLHYLKSQGFQTTCWHPFARKVIGKLPGFPNNPPDFGLAVAQYFEIEDRENLFKEIFSAWNLSLQLEQKDPNNEVIIADSLSYRFMVKENLLYEQDINHGLINLLPKPKMVFLIELNTNFAWYLNKGNPEFYEMYPENPNSSATLEKRFISFQTDVYNGMLSLYNELKIPVILLPNTGLETKDRKHEIWMEIMSRYI